MSYNRVIPRDLFNEGNLLKCYGQLYLNLEKMGLQSSLIHDGDTFDVIQNEASGGLSIANITLRVPGRSATLERPLNSRHPYPLYLTTEGDEEIEVFNEDGSFTDEMTSFLGAEPA